MNFLLKGRHSVIRSQLIKRQMILRPFDGKQIIINKRYNSQTINIIMLSQIAPVAGIVVGRLIQNRWPRLRYSDTKSIIDLIYSNKLKVISSVGLIGGTIIKAIDRFSEETPLTKRKRVVIFNKRDFEPISEVIFKIIHKTYKKRILTVNHTLSQRVDKIVRKLIDSNQSLKEIKQNNWQLYVIRAPNTANAFVLPTGQIFVYTGIINVCDNDDQLAAILAHELSHTLLSHGKEVLTQEVCIDLFHTLSTLLLWIRLHPISALIGTVVTSFALKSLFILPKRRLIELEADFVGLTLSAKACYDVREGSAFWMKMSALEDQNLWVNTLSTHPANDHRYELMDSYMESMIRIMECSDCPKLSETDPRHNIKRKILRSKREIYSQIYSD